MLRTMEPIDASPEPGPTLGEYLAEWLTVQASQLQPSTWLNYRNAVRCYLAEHLGDLPLAHLTVRDCNRLYAHLHAEGGQGGAPLRAKTVLRIHNVLHKALQDAIALGLIDSNPSQRATLPRYDRDDGDPANERHMWTPEQLRTFLEHTKDHRFGDLWFVAAFTGLRRGELLGLRWTDLELDGEAPLLRVRRSLSVIGGHPRLKETKTRRPRTLHLDERTVAVFRRRFDLEAEHLAERGPTGCRRRGLVFTDRNGRHLAPETVSQDFRRTVVAAPVPTLRLHDLRHLHATLLLQAGVPVKVVSERLGHRSTQVTLEIYAHVLPSMDAEAVHRFSAYVLDDAAERPPT
jgi:integrase